MAKANFLEAKTPEQEVAEQLSETATQETNKEVVSFNSKEELDNYIEEKFKKLASENTPVQSIPRELVYPASTTSILDDEIDILQFEPKDRIYKTVDGTKPITLSIAVKSKKSRPLTWYNEKTRKTHALRYATNHPSIFEDVQGNTNQMQIGSVVMNDGILFVPKENVTLQRFLAIHPDNGVIFMEHDPIKENKDNTATEYAVLAAKNKAVSISDVEKEYVLRVLQGVSYDPNTRKNGALDRLLFAECNKNPENVSNVIDDKMTKFKGMVSYGLQNDVIRLENNRLYMKGNVITEIPINVKDPMEYIASFLRKAEGQNVFNAIESSVSKTV